MKVSIETKIQTGFALALACLLLAGAGAWWSARRHLDAFQAVDHTHEVLNELEAMLVNLLNVETGSRGFAISGDEHFLEPYQAGVAAVGKAFDAAKQLTLDNPDQQRRLAALAPLIEARIGHANEVFDSDAATPPQRSSWSPRAGAGKAWTPSASWSPKCGRKSSGSCTSGRPRRRGCPARRLGSWARAACWRSCW